MVPATHDIELYISVELGPFDWHADGSFMLAEAAAQPMDETSESEAA